MSRVPDGSRYVVGIDLGTTNSALAWMDLESGDSALASAVGGESDRPRPFPIAQLVADGEISTRPTLPSALYIGAAEEAAPGAWKLPWGGSENEVVGLLANGLGARQAGRLISSAKSWLCHGGVDREAAILPWGSSLDLAKLSPVDVSARFLAHLGACWAQDHPRDPLSEQDVILAVPASFDEVARELTVQAATQAGFARIRLLEEPQAALYAWTATHPDWRDVLGGMEQILVVDVGGGTTDFSLVAVRETAGRRGLERTFVGDHLLVGGDNMDLVLADRVAGERRSSLNASQWQQLTLQSRLAKERLLNEAESTEVVEIAVAGSGRRLLGNTLRGRLTQDMASEALLEGFFPRVEADARPAEGSAELQEFGLPFAEDRAITRHLAAFLARAGAAAGEAIRPDAVLFNGGTLKPGRIRQRLREQVGHWTGRVPVELEDADPDLAVAHGAVAYGSALRGRGDRISGGSARSYFLGIETAEGPAMLCLVGRGMAEGQELALPEPVLELVANQHVQFPLYVSTSRMGDQPGQVHPLDPEDTVILPPLGSRLPFGKSLEARTVPVTLRSLLTETGTLEIWCEARDTPHRWKLSFDLRGQASSESWEQDEDRGDSSAEAVVSEEALAEAGALLEEAFSGSRDPVRVVKSLEGALGVDRRNWPIPAMRRLWETVWLLESARARSADHEARWLNLCGYLARPGYGAVDDELRAEKVWRLYNGGLRFPKSSQCAAEWWVLWKRIAGGLSRPQQTALLQELRPVLLPGNRRRKNRKKSSAQELREMWQVAGSLERVSVGPKSEIFAGLVGDLNGLAGLSDAEVWAVGRLGARVPVYGSADGVMPPDRVVATVRSVLGLPEPLSGGWALALAQLARLSGDRARDLTESLREACAKRLEQEDVHAELASLVRTTQAGSEGVRARIVADTLPTGLRIG